ncbi:MAG TPA: FAD-binding oxidoreductase [Wenzhouxiangellaceae bacterium]|nr:FAD-binding oxidoreductase [Wenzhouxiangellaceae bacterium]
MNDAETALPRFHANTWYQHDLGEAADVDGLSGSTRAGTVVVGAGLAGLSTALGLVERGEHDILVMDRGGPAEGASGRNGGFVFGGFSLDNLELARQRGAEQAALMHGWTRSAVDLVRRRCETLDVPVSDGGVLLADWFGKPERLQRFRDQMRDLLDFRLDRVDHDEMPRYVASDRYGAGLMEPGSFHFNPLAYARAIAARLRESGASVVSNAPVLSMRPERGGWRLETPAAEIRADRIVLATGGYDRRLWPRAQRAIQPIGTYVMVTEPLGNRLSELIPGGVAVYDTRFAFDYYRPLYDGRLLWGGRISVADRDPASIRKLLYRDMLRVFPSLDGVQIDFAWGGWMSYARHQMPILGELAPGLWSALAFGGHGMAPTTLAGEVLAEAMTGDWTRLAEFETWGPTWAGGPFGRAAIQGVYWWKQFNDVLRAL